MSDSDIIEFDTLKGHPHGFQRVHIGMTHVVSRDEHPSWMPQYRPNLVVTATKEGNNMSTTYTFGLKNIDAVIVNITKDIYASLHGYGNQELFIDNVKQIIGKRSKYNSAESDLNTGRIIIIKMDEK